MTDYIVKEILQVVELELEKREVIYWLGDLGLLIFPSAFQSPHQSCSNYKRSPPGVLWGFSEMVNAEVPDTQLCWIREE